MSSREIPCGPARSLLAGLILPPQDNFRLHSPHLLFHPLFPGEKTPLPPSAAVIIHARTIA